MFLRGQRLLSEVKGRKKNPEEEKTALIFQDRLLSDAACSLEQVATALSFLTEPYVTSQENEEKDNNDTQPLSNSLELDNWLYELSFIGRQFSLHMKTIHEAILYPRNNIGHQKKEAYRRALRIAGKAIENPGDAEECIKMLQKLQTNHHLDPESPDLIIKALSILAKILFCLAVIGVPLMIYAATAGLFPMVVIVACTSIVMLLSIIILEEYGLDSLKKKSVEFLERPYFANKKNEPSLSSNSNIASSQSSLSSSSSSSSSSSPSNSNHSSTLFKLTRTHQHIEELITHLQKPEAQKAPAEKKRLLSLSK